MAMEIPKSWSGKLSPPEWVQLLGLPHVSNLQRAYYGHQGSVNFEDILEIAKRMPTFACSLKGRFIFSTEIGVTAFDIPPFVSSSGGLVTEGTVEVRTFGDVGPNEVDCLAIALKDGMNTRHLPRARA